MDSEEEEEYDSAEESDEEESEEGSEEEEGEEEEEEGSDDGGSGAEDDNAREETRYWVLRKREAAKRIAQLEAKKAWLGLKKQKLSNHEAKMLEGAYVTYHWAEHRGKLEKYDRMRYESLLRKERNIGNVMRHLAIVKENMEHSPPAPPDLEQYWGQQMSYWTSMQDKRQEQLGLYFPLVRDDEAFVEAAVERVRKSYERDSDAEDSHADSYVDEKQPPDPLKELKDAELSLARWRYRESLARWMGESKQLKDAEREVRRLHKRLGKLRKKHDVKKKRRTKEEIEAAKEAKEIQKELVKLAMLQLKGKHKVEFNYTDEIMQLARAQIEKGKATAAKSTETKRRKKEMEAAARAAEVDAAAARIAAEARAVAPKKQKEEPKQEDEVVDVTPGGGFGRKMRFQIVR